MMAHRTQKLGWNFDEHFILMNIVSLTPFTHPHHIILTDGLGVSHFHK